MTTEITVGKYRFIILDNTLEYNGRIFSRSFRSMGILNAHLPPAAEAFEGTNCGALPHKLLVSNDQLSKIGSKNYTDCVNVSVSYNSDNRPNKAHIPTLVSHRLCTTDNNLESGEGSILMIKTILRYIHEKIPEITNVSFEDFSKLECGTDEEKLAKQSRALGTHAYITHVYPVSLFYFSLAFNGITWYEKHFNAKLDSDRYQKYREGVRIILYNKESKMDFEQFLAIATPNIEQILELKQYYEKADTYHQFFSSIPQKRRCPLVRNWIHTFMAHVLKDIFQHTDWFIDINTMDTPPITGGKRNTRKKSKKCDTYYCPNTRIYRYDSQADHSLMTD